jgi:hypothetical protein
MTNTVKRTSDSDEQLLARFEADALPLHSPGSSPTGSATVS